MLDFMTIICEKHKDYMSVEPSFELIHFKDLMTKGGDFYAIWDSSTGLWSEDELVAVKLIDNEIDKYTDEAFNYANRILSNDILLNEVPDQMKELVKFIVDKDGKKSAVKKAYMRVSKSGMIDRWHKFVKDQLRDHFHQLDSQLIFADTVTKRTHYASKKLDYSMNNSETPSYDRLMSVLYSPEERKKLEWAIGAVVSGDSKNIQKFIVIYGPPASGKSTVLEIIQKLFKGYWVAFNAKDLASGNNQFPLEAFKSNPLVAIQPDGNLSKIKDNSIMNSLISHETMPVNTKYQKLYSSKFNSFLFMGTNSIVEISDSKSGIVRRLIDVNPTGEKIPISEYRELVKNIDFELGGIAKHCLDIYLENKNYYDDYVPTLMISASNHFYNFIMDSYMIFKKENMTTLKAAWEMYINYCNRTNITNYYPQMLFKEELKSYFKDFREEKTANKGVIAYYEEFISDKFENKPKKRRTKKETNFLLECTESRFDREFSSIPAQYATIDEKPIMPWSEVTLTLNDISTDKVHYVKPPENMIVVDFDIKDKDGNKSFELNAEAASKWPPTYAELSKSGAGIHLHYIYEGDVSKLSHIYDDNIEIKTFKGGSSLRRKLTKCNDIPIATISSGLPLKEEKPTINMDGFKDEKHLRNVIYSSMAKKTGGGTFTAINWINEVLNRAYDSGMSYDLRNTAKDIIDFASNSSNHAKECLTIAANMKYCSNDILTGESDEEPIENYKSGSIAFFDIEVYSNLFLVVYKFEGPENAPIVLYNPSPTDISNIVNFKLVGFNCRRYDNHILYARMLGYSNEQLFEKSQEIIGGKTKNPFFGKAYDISYTDVYDFSTVKQSLKKFEVELGIRHKEMDIPWDQPAPEDRWEEIAGYCINDVLATEAVFNARKGDWIARQILVDICKSLGIRATVNDTTNGLTTKIIFRGNQHPNLVYTDLSETFPGYSFEKGHNTYRGEDVGFGGYVYAEPGMYYNVALLDVASLHPHSIKAMNCFGDYTQNFVDLMDARIDIKHKDFESAGKLFNGALKPYLDDESKAKDLSQALKIAINSVYGLTSASFENPFKDPRNVNNIVALRGALFMVNLKHEVQDRGFTVAHIKTDSIKIPEATPEIIDFCMRYANQYGYTFEHEATYEKLCLVNNAVYIAKDSADGHWTATGTQFQVPYVFKTLFSKEPIEFDDLCETKMVTSSLYLDMNENLPDGEHNYKFVGKVGKFCPIKEGCGGGLLMREKDGKYNAATGSKGYRWLESDDVKVLGKEDCIDKEYYRKLADEAIDAISKYGDFDIFAK